MLADLGYALYRVACVLAIAALCYVAYQIAFVGAKSESALYVLISGVAVIVWLFGRACRSLLAGK